MQTILIISILLNALLYYQLKLVLKAAGNIYANHQEIIEMDASHIKRLTEINTLLQLRHKALQNEQYEDIAAMDMQLNELINKY